MSAIVPPAAGPSGLGHELEALGLQWLGPVHDLPERREHELLDCPLLETMSERELRGLGEAMIEAHARAGQALIHEGERGDWMMLVLRGSVDVFKQVGEGGRTARLAVVLPGATIGEMSMFDGAPRYASCVALTDTRVGVLSRARIAELIEAHPAAGAKVLMRLNQQLAQRLRNTSNQVVRLLRKE